MPKPGVYRSPWHDFPDVVIQTTVHKLRSRPAYDEAKRGVGEAAFEVVQELIKPEKITFAFDIIVPVMQFDRDKPNALPLVYATALAKHFDAYLEIGVRQANVVSHTFADAQTRILGQPMFIGKIHPGSRVLIVDDVVTYGSTLANLRGWLQQQGAIVAGREARFLAGLKNEHEMQRLIVAAQELTLLQERQLSLERTNEIDPPLQPC
jgi:hypothetical protein